MRGSFPISRGLFRGMCFRLAAMMMLTDGAGVSKINVVLSQAVYAGIALSVAALYGLTLLPLPAESVPLVAIAFGALILLFAMPAVFQLMLNVTTWLLRKVRRNQEIVTPHVTTTFWQNLIPPICSVIMWTLNGIAFWLFVRSMTDIAVGRAARVYRDECGGVFCRICVVHHAERVGFPRGNIGVLFVGVLFRRPLRWRLRFSRGCGALQANFWAWRWRWRGSRERRSRIPDENKGEVTAERKQGRGDPAPTKTLFDEMKTRVYFIALAVVWVLIFAYGIYFSALSVQRHRAFLTNASDLGQIDQAVWNTSQGRPLEFTRRTGEQSVRLTDHVEPLFVLISPVFYLYDNVEALLILQSFVIAIGALAVFWIAHAETRAIVGEWFMACAASRGCCLRECICCFPRCKRRTSRNFMR